MLILIENTYHVKCKKCIFYNYIETIFSILQNTCYKINVLKNTNKKYLLNNYIEKKISTVNKLNVYISPLNTAMATFTKCRL